MTPRRKQGRPDSIVAWLVADPWRKLGAIVLALVSWEYLDKRVNAEHESKLAIILPGQQKGIDNYLRIDINSKEYTLTASDVWDATNDKPLEELTLEIKVRGEKAKIDRMKGTLQLVYRPSISQLSEASETGWLTFGVKDLLHEKGDFAEDLETLDSVNISPERIRLRILRNTTKNLLLVEKHVSLEFGSSGLEERLSNPEFSHTSVDLRGPKAAIESLITTGPIFRGKVSKVQQDATRVRVELELLPTIKGIVTETPIFVVYAVEPDWQPVELKNVPIDIDNKQLPSEQKLSAPFRVEPESMAVLKLDVKGDLAERLNRIKSNPEELADFVRKHVRLVVYTEEYDLKKARWPVKPLVEFVLFDDIPTPRKGIDFKEVQVDTVYMIKK